MPRRLAGGGPPRRPGGSRFPYEAAGGSTASYAAARLTAAKVLVDSAIHATRRARGVRRRAQAAATLDGVYCHCDCSKHSGHRSLLTCYESTHAAYCDICMGEAMMASSMVGQGKSLTEIRAAIDRQFGS